MDQPDTTLDSFYDYMTIGAASELARVKEQTIRRWIREGRLKAYGYRGCLRIRMSELLPEWDPRTLKGSRPRLSAKKLRQQLPALSSKSSVDGLQ